MKRLERILKHARHEGLLCALWFSVAVASGVWAAVASMYGNGPGGALLAFLAIAAFRRSWWHRGERRRLLRQVLVAELAWNPCPLHKPEMHAWAVALATLAFMAVITAAVHLF